MGLHNVQTKHNQELVGAEAFCNLYGRFSMSHSNNFNCQTVIQIQSLTQVFTSFDKQAIDALQSLADRVSHVEATWKPYGGRHIRI